MNFLPSDTGRTIASRSLIVLILSAIVAVTIACSDDPEVSPQPIATPQELVSQNNETKTEEVRPSPTSIPGLSPATATTVPSLILPSTVVPAQTPTIIQATATHTSTPEPQEIRFDQFGFSIVVETKESTVLTSLLEEDASANQGILLFEYKGTQAVLMWMTSTANSNQVVQAHLMALLTEAQPENIFTVITEGNITVDGNQGIFGAFSTQDAETVVTGGGIIGAWSCISQGIIPALLVTGTDDTTVQIRFKRLIDSFTCDRPR
jgi:hypothetical protein